MDLNELRSLAANVTGKVVSATEELVEKGKKQVDILSLENKLAKAQRQLGALVYSLSRSGQQNPALVQKYIDEIAQLESQLEQASRTAKQDEFVTVTTASPVCPQCGHVVSPEDVFCCGCGARL